jgi:leukotriene-A4 hydrolase
MARFDPHSYTDPSQGTTTRLELDLAVDFAARTLAGEAVLHLAEPGAGPLDLDTRDLTIEAVLDAAGTPIPYELADAEDWMGARLTVDRPAGTAAIRIRYTTSPEASALQWLEPRHTAGGEQPYMFSQCQPHHARSIVPIQDSARVRFAYSARITVPDPLTAVMSAAPGVAEAGDTAGTRVLTFEMPQPIPAYLLAIAVGNIVGREIGPRSTVYTEPEMLEACAYEFGDIDKMLLAAEGLFGPYRWDRFDFLVMPPAFPYGGMENPRLTFLTPTLVAGDRSLTNVLAHELAHSWTGNLVTNATMNDFWLNEGFTVWAERRIIEALYGVEAAAMGAAIGRHGLDQAVERFGEDSEYTRLENDLEGVDPDSVYSVVPYEKGFLLVALMERTLGREPFDEFILEYMERFQFTSLTTPEFEAFVEQARPGLLEKVDAKRWIHGEGVPETAPAFPSPMLDRLWGLGDGFADGARPDVDEWSRWSVEEKLVYLQRIPAVLDVADCAWFDEQFDLTASTNPEILNQWLVIAAGSGYEPAFERIRSFLGSIGRMKFLKPIYAALHGNVATRALAAEVFAASKDDYHPIARTGLEALLSPS